jgi:hypothetical protein
LVTFCYSEVRGAIYDPSTLAFFSLLRGVVEIKILGNLSLSVHIWENLESKLLVHLKPSRHKEEDTQQSSTKS